MDGGFQSVLKLESPLGGKIRLLGPSLDSLRWGCDIGYLPSLGSASSSSA